MSESKLVFSTESGSHKKDKNQIQHLGSDHGSCENAPWRLQGVVGKAVTVLFNLPLPENEAVNLLKAMQSSFGCGGALKDNTLELRGDVRKKVEDFFAKKGYENYASWRMTAYRSMRDCVEDLERHGMLIRIKDEVDPDLEMAEIQRQVYAAAGPAILLKGEGFSFSSRQQSFGTLERARFFISSHLEEYSRRDCD